MAESSEVFPIDHSTMDESLDDLAEGIKMSATCLHPEYVNNIAPCFELTDSGVIIPGILVRACQATGGERLFIPSTSKRLYENIMNNEDPSPRGALQAYKWYLDAKLLALSHAEREQRALYFTELSTNKAKAPEAEMDGGSESIEKCGGCGEDDEAKLKMCARCLKAWYCSKECQKKDWKNHKKVCGSVSGSGES